MTHKTTITDNYILITSDEEIKFDDWVYNHLGVLFQYGIEHTLHPSTKKVIAHLPLSMYSNLEGVVKLPPLPSGEDDVEKLSWEYTFNKFGEVDDFYDTQEGYIEGWKKHSEKYRFTEEDMIQAFAYGRTLEPFDSFEHFILSLSQPKIPIGFKCEMGTKYFEDSRWETHPIIVVNQEGQNVMLGEWIY